MSPVLTTLFLLLLPGTLPAQGGGGRALTEALDSIVRTAVEDGFSGQVLVAKDGEVVLHRGYGPADPGSGVPVDTSTVFAIGSVTKRFTRTAILKLQEEGQLSTSDPVSRFLDGLPPEKGRITVGQLLRMEGGLHEYHDDSGDHQAMTRDEALRRIGAQELRFDPGTDRAYSNSGYVLLAAVVEEASGRPFEEYLREKVFGPAGMVRTGFHGEDLWPDRTVARGYGMRSYGENAPHRWPTPTWALKGAGGMVAPAGDLLHFMESLRKGRIVGSGTLAVLYPPEQPHLHYAGGDDFGFVTEVMELDHGGHVIIVSTNHGYGYEDLPFRLAALVRGEALQGHPVEAGLRADEDRPDPTGRPTDPVEVEGDDPRAGPGLPDSPRGRAAGWILTALEDGSSQALREFVDTRLSVEMREAFPVDVHLEILGDLARKVRDVGVQGVRPVSPFTLVIVLGNGHRIDVTVEAQAPHLIDGIRIGGRCPDS
jgi:CubicO group peptidase (beta-lactamase class C family)